MEKKELMWTQLEKRSYALKDEKHKRKAIYIDQIPIQTFWKVPLPR